jgi:hypothetical protein
MTTSLLATIFQLNEANVQRSLEKGPQENSARDWDCMLDGATDGVSAMNFASDLDDQGVPAIGPISDSSARDASIRKVGHLENFGRPYSLIQFFSNIIIVIFPSVHFRASIEKPPIGKSGFKRKTLSGSFPIKSGRGHVNSKSMTPRG